MKKRTHRHYSKITLSQGISHNIQTLQHVSTVSQTSHRNLHAYHCLMHLQQTYIWIFCGIGAMTAYDSSVKGLLARFLEE